MTRVYQLIHFKESLFGVDCGQFACTRSIDQSLLTLIRHSVSGCGTNQQPTVNGWVMQCSLHAACIHFRAGQINRNNRTRTLINTLILKQHCRNSRQICLQPPSAPPATPARSPQSHPTSKQASTISFQALEIQGHALKDESSDSTYKAGTKPQVHTPNIQGQAQTYAFIHFIYKYTHPKYIYIYI